MTKQDKKIEKLLFEVYEKGVENNECDLTNYCKKIKEAINFTDSCDELRKNCDWCNGNNRTFDKK